MAGTPGVIQRLRNWVWNPNYEQRATYGPILGFKDWETYKREYNLTDVGSVGVEQGMRLTDVYTCINIRSQSIAWLPKGLKRRSEKTGTFTLDQNPLHNLVSSQVNSYLSGYNYWTNEGIDLDGWGNHYSVIQNRSTPNLTTFLPLEPWEVTPKLLDDGSLIYKYKGEMIPSREMLHFRLFARGGYKGISPIRQNANKIGYAIQQESFAHNALGTKTGQYLRSEVPLDDEVKKKAGGTLKKKILSGEIPVLDRLRLESMTINPHDAQFIETSRLTTQQIYGIYRVPKIFGQDYTDANFANSEQQNLVFVQHALQPIVTMIEQELNMKLLPTGSKDFFHINVNALLKGDTQTRMELYRMMLTNAVVSPQWVLEKEDEPWTEDDRTKWIQGAMVPAKKQKKMNIQAPKSNGVSETKGTQNGQN